MVSSLSPFSCQGQQQMSQQRLLNTDRFYLHAAGSASPLFQLLGTSASIHWALFQNHGWSTLCKYSISPVRLSLLQGFHWEHRYFAQGARDGVSGVKDNIFSYSLTVLNPSRDGAPTTSLGSQFQYFPTFTVRNFFLELSLKYSLLVYSYSPLSYHHLPP